MHGRSFIPPTNNSSIIFEKQNAGVKMFAVLCICCMIWGSFLNLSKPRL